MAVLREFELTRLPSAAGRAPVPHPGPREPDDQRLVALAEVRDLTIVRDDAGRITGPAAARAHPRRLPGQPALGPVAPTASWPGWTGTGSCCTSGRPWRRRSTELGPVIRSLAPRTGALGLEQVLVQFRDARPATGELMLRMSRPPGAGLTLRVTDPPTEPLRALDDYTQKVIRARRRGTVYPYELIPLIIRSPDPGGATATFTEYDLDDAGAPVPVDRPPGCNTAGIVLGVVSTPTERYPEGMTRVVLLGDPTQALGALAEPECARVHRRLDLAERAAACRSSGSRCRPARGSRWTPAPRTWTGSPGRCGGSSSSPRPAARSTSSSPASTSAPSRTGTPRRRCSCTPRASWS